MAFDASTLLDLTLRAAGIPIVGVRPDPTMVGAWVIDFDPSATSAQRAQGANLAVTFNPADQTPGVNAAAAVMGGTPMAKAILATLLDQQLGRPLTTADAPALRALFTKTIGYYRFIVNNGL